MHESDRPQRAQYQRRQRENGLAKPPDHYPADDGHEDERVQCSSPIGAFHPADGLVADDWRAGDVSVDGSQLVDEPDRAFTVPHVDFGMDLEQEPTALADELAPQLGRDIVERDEPGLHVPLEKAQLLAEIPHEVGLVEREPRLSPDRICRAQRLEDLCESAVDRPQLRAGPVRTRFTDGEADTTLERFELLREAREIEPRRRADPQRCDERSNVADDLRLRGLVLGNEQQCAVDAYHRWELFEGLELPLKLSQGCRGGQSSEARAVLRIDDVTFPHHGLGAVRLKVQKVVVKPDHSHGPERARGQDARAEQNGGWVPGDEFDERHTGALERCRMIRRRRRSSQWAPRD